jgi:glutathione S-transferase
LTFNRVVVHYLVSRASAQSPGGFKAFAQALHIAPLAGPRACGGMHSFQIPDSAAAWSRTMSEVTLFGFPRSVYVQMAGIVLTHKEVQYAFHDLETEMNTPSHIALHPFERVPILRHGDFTVYETSAIVSYVDDAFSGPNLTPSDPRTRARMNQWISAVNAYYYPYLIYHVSHERNVFPQLGIASDEKVVAHAMPTVETCLQTLERELAQTGQFLLGPGLSLADFYMLPIIHGFGFAPEAQEMYPRFPAIRAWRERMEALPTMQRFRAGQPARGPIEHARRWAVSHRPKY